jgi:hypothetical protein
MPSVVSRRPQKIRGGRRLRDETEVPERTAILFLTDDPDSRIARRDLFADRGRAIGWYTPVSCSTDA